MKQKLKHIGLWVVTLTILITAPSSLKAVIIAQDSFDGTGSGFLNGQNTGTGFGGETWNTNSTFFDDPKFDTNARLDYPGVTESGRMVTMRGDFREAWRTVTSGAGFASYLDGNGNIGADGTELWVGVLLGRETNETVGGTLGISFLRDSSSPQTTNESIIYAGDNFNDTNTHMIAIHMQFAAGTDSYTVYTDPNLSLDPTGGVLNTVADLSFDMVRLEGRVFGTPHSQINFDELVFGETAQDLGFPIPEPSTYALVVSAFLALCFFRRRRNQ
ncbi:MAG: PEP-CTERM sorting domain-containing protein [Verrucomicrobiota bacterium]